MSCMVAPLAGHTIPTVEPARIPFGRTRVMGVPLPPRASDGTDAPAAIAAAVDAIDVTKERRFMRSFEER
jgi:hypothetical protein